MTKLAYLRKPRPEHQRQAKERPCLKCREPFKSEWWGERVCPRCKTKSAWREGARGFPEEWMS